MNVESLILGTQRLFGDTSEAQITRSDIIRWLNEGQIKIVRKTQCLQRHVETASVKGQASYELPDDCLFVRRATYDDNLVPPVAFEELDTVAPDRDGSNSTGNAMYYYLWSNSIWFYPAASVTENGKIDIWYIRTPVELSSNSDEPEIPEYMHEQLINYAVMKAKELDEDYDAAMMLRNGFDVEMQDARNDAQSVQKDSYPAVRALPGDLG